MQLKPKLYSTLGHVRHDSPPDGGNLVNISGSNFQTVLKTNTHTNKQKQRGKGMELAERLGVPLSYILCFYLLISYPSGEIRFGSNLKYVHHGSDRPLLGAHH